ncbi:TPA: hypothetical protein ACS7XC_001965 [Providencia alcalifaciens]
MDILNSREIAITVWLLIIIIFISFSSKRKDISPAFKGVLSAFFSRRILSVIGFMIAYIAVVAYCLSKLNLWNIEQLKNTIFWCVFIGFMSLFKLEKIKIDRTLFKNLVIDQLKLLAVIQFIVGVYTFPFWIEVILVPFSTLVVAMLVVSKTDRKYSKVRTLLEFCLSLFGVVLVIYTVFMLITYFDDFGKIKTAYDFIVPPLLTLCYLPFLFLLMVYSTYDVAFSCTKISIKNKHLRYIAKFYAVILFNFRISLVDRWRYHIVRYNVNSYSDLINSFKHIFKLRAAERNPKDVPKDKGWNLQKARKFFVDQGIESGFYNKFYDENWFAQSPMKELNDGWMPDNIAYYIEGSEDIANTLKLIVNINDVNRAPSVCEQFAHMAEALSVSSLNQVLSPKMMKSILDCESYDEKYENKIILLTIEPWHSHKLNGYDIKFVISSSQ